MPTFLPSNKEQMFVQVETTYGTIPNGTGTATVAATDACHHTKCTLTPLADIQRRPDKNYILSAIPGIAVWRSATFNVTMALRGSGVAPASGLPDCDPFLQSLFGAASSPAGTYALSDTPAKSVSIYSFMTGDADVTQRCLAGGMVQTAEFAFGQNFGEVTFSGDGKWVVDSEAFSDLTTPQKCGLTSFPTCPASFTSVGEVQSGYEGSISFDSYSASVVGGRIRYTMNREMRRMFNEGLPSTVVQGERNIGIEAQIYFEDAAGLAALVSAATRSVTLTPVTIVMGTGTGYTWTHTLKRVLLSPPEYDDSGSSWVVRVSGQAHSSDGAALDEAGLVLT